jgi:hypothetical protein
MLAFARASHIAVCRWPVFAFAILWLAAAVTFGVLGARDAKGAIEANDEQAVTAVANFTCAGLCAAALLLNFLLFGLSFASQTAVWWADFAFAILILAALALGFFAHYRVNRRADL